MEAVIRVLVANRPRLLRELVLSTLSEQAGIDVVGEAEDETEVPSLVAETRPDFLLIALDESQRRPALCDLLLQKFPEMGIIAVAPSTSNTMRWLATARYRLLQNCWERKKQPNFYSDFE